VAKVRVVIAATTGSKKVAATGNGTLTPPLAGNSGEVGRRGNQPGPSLTPGIAMEPTSPGCTLGSVCTRRVFTVHALSSSLHSFSLSPPSATMSLLLLNGAPLPPGTPPFSLPLRLGANIVDITVVGALAALGVTVAGSRAPPLRGAALPFAEVEAEDAAFSGSLVGPSFAFTTLAAEASGRRAVALDAPGAWVEFTLPAAANAVAVRFSVPDGVDAPLAVLVDGAPLRSLLLTSNYSWQYGAYPFTKNASDGRPHHYFDTARFLLPSLLPAGARLRLQRPPPPPLAAAPACPVPGAQRANCGFSGVNAPLCLAKGCCWGPPGGAPSQPMCYYPEAPPTPPPAPADATITIDLADFYAVPPPSPPPPGFRSVVDAGADPTGARDSAAAFAAALAAPGGARVWVPPGTYAIQSLDALPVGSNVTLAGAGPWHALLVGRGARVAGREAAAGGSRDVQLHGVSLVGDVRVRNDSSPFVGVGGALSNSVVANVHIAHQKCGMWINGPLSSLLVSAVEVSDTMADGINLHHAVTDSVVEHSFFRNTGDDCLASWSDARGPGGASARNAFRANTLVLPVLANHVAVYGGADNAVVGNDARESLTEGGAFHVGNRFGSVPLSGTTLVANNSALRAGCFSGDYPADPAALWFFALDASLTGAVRAEGNELVDSPLAAVAFIAADGMAVGNVAISGLAVRGAGAEVFNVVGSGAAVVQGAVAVGAPLGVRNCSAGFALVDGGGNAGWGGASACTPR
jgi:hypothetical protein